MPKNMQTPSEAHTNRQRAYEKRLKASGWSRKSIWIPPGTQDLYDGTVEYMRESPRWAEGLEAAKKLERAAIRKAAREAKKSEAAA